jgi:hypothetical protein
MRWIDGEKEKLKSVDIDDVYVSLPDLATNKQTNKQPNLP